MRCLLFFFWLFTATSQFSTEIEDWALVIKDSLDTTISPCQDFDGYVCGKWREEMDATSWDTLTLLGSANSRNLGLGSPLVKSLSSSLPKASFKGKLKQAFDACVKYMTNPVDDHVKAYLERRIEAMGGWPLMGFSSSLNLHGMDTKSAAAYMLAKAMRSFDIHRTPFFQLEEKGTHFYFVIKRFQEVVMKSRFEIIYESLHGQVSEDASARIDEVYDRMKKVDKKWRQLSKSVEAQEMEETTLEEMFKLSSFDWSTFFSTLTQNYSVISEKMGVSYSIDVGKLTTALGELVAEFPSADLRDYLTYQFVSSNLKFDLSPSRTERPDAEERCFKKLDHYLEIAHTRLILEKHASEDSLPILQAIRAAVFEEYRSMVDSMPYDLNIKKHLWSKIDTLTSDLVFPPLNVPEYVFDQYYNSLEIVPGQWFKTLENLNEFWNQRVFDGITKPWQMDLDMPMGSGIANGYYSSADNYFKLTAGYLLPPYFHFNYSLAYNFASIGWVMSHEVGHALDSNFFNKAWNGRRLTFPESVRNQLKLERRCLENYYSGVCTNYSTNSAVCADGTKAVAENLADQLATRAAYGAYRKLVQRYKVDGPQLSDSVSSDQFYFIVISRNLCGYYSKEAAEMKAVTDEHTLISMRAQAVVKNYPAFADAFSCSNTDIYASKPRCPIYGLQYT